MIRINLLSQKKKKPVDRGQQEVLLGFLVLLMAGFVVFMFVHRPMKEDVAKLQKSNKRLKQKNRRTKKNVNDVPQLETAVKGLEARKKAIAVLDDARATPAFLLYELSRILTPNKEPTMHDEMALMEAKNANRRIDRRWDPKHVWVESYKEKDGEFTIEGGAQSDADMTHLAKRMQASIFFENVVPEGGKEVTDRKNGVTYYEFTIKGKVVY